MKSDRGPTQFEKVSSWSSCSYDTAHLQGPRQISTVLEIHQFNICFIQYTLLQLLIYNTPAEPLRFFKDSTPAGAPASVF